MLFAQKCPNLTAFRRPEKYDRMFPKGVKIPQNRSEPWAIAHALGWKMAKIDNFRRILQIFHQLCKRCENSPKSIETMGYSPCFWFKNGQNHDSFRRILQILRNFAKGVKIHPKSIKTMGYSPCFLLKNAQFWQDFTKSSEIFRIFPKGVKIPQNRSKPWAIAHAFCSKIPNFDRFYKILRNISYFSKRFENSPKSIETMGYSPCFLLKNAQFWQDFRKPQKFIQFCQKVWKFPKIHQNHGL